jgi:hypothetical protein
MIVDLSEMKFPSEEFSEEEEMTTADALPLAKLL